MGYVETDVVKSFRSKPSICTLVCDPNNNELKSNYTLKFSKNILSQHISIMQKTTNKLILSRKSVFVPFLNVYEHCVTQCVT